MDIWTFACLITVSYTDSATVVVRPLWTPLASKSTETPTSINFSYKRYVALVPYNVYLTSATIKFFAAVAAAHI